MLSTLMLLSSCGTIQKWGMRSASPMFKKSSDALTRENSWDFFRDSAPGNLKFLELLYLQDPDNLTLLGVLIKGYSGYAFAVPETLAFDDELAGKEDSPWKEQAMIHYTRALDYGLDYLDKKDISRSDLLNFDEQKLEKALNKELDEDDLSAVLFTAQAWGSLINLQKDNVSMVSQVPKVKVLFDWVCKKDPKIENGVCEIFYAQYESSRPLMLGGNPKKGEELYLAAIKNRPHHLLMRTGYMQFLLLPGFEQEKYEAQAKELKNEITKWNTLNRDSLEDNSEYKYDKSLNLYNAIAKKRFEIIEKNKKKIF
ncbi:MAG TPA: TRAP transporter TatT component family protein [Bacteriovoracaceae bacterium]|nr:TRAP transporter TatT component family protein [Bacteriovoracaceae bacterium]